MTAVSRESRDCPLHSAMRRGRTELKLSWEEEVKAAGPNRSMLRSQQEQDNGKHTKKGHWV